MSLNFKKEVNLIESNDKISDKIMILNLMDDFYQEVKDQLGNSKIEEYDKFELAVFDITANELNLPENFRITPDYFMKTFFFQHKCSYNYSTPEILKIIEKYEVNLNNFISSYGFTREIDRCYFYDLYSKFRIVKAVKKYLNRVIYKVRNTYSKEESVNIIKDIRNIISIKIGDYLEECFEHNVVFDYTLFNLGSYLDQYVKDYFENNKKYTRNK